MKKLLTMWWQIYLTTHKRNHQAGRQHYEGTRTTYKLIEKAKKIEQLADCLMFHRTRQGSIVQSKQLNNSREFFLASQEFEAYVIEHTPSVFSQEDLERLFM